LRFWLESQIVGAVPAEDELCEFGCRKTECRFDEWVHCEKRLSYLARQLAAMRDQSSTGSEAALVLGFSDGKLSGQSFRKGTTGAPILVDVPGAIECRLVSIVEQGDHHIVVGEVIDAHLNKPPSGRPDNAILEMKDLGENVFYGG
jgi:hypothetical protein